MGPEWMSLQVHLPRHIEMTVIPHFPVIQGFCWSWQARLAWLAHHLNDAMVIISKFGHKSKLLAAECWSNAAAVLHRARNRPLAAGYSQVGLEPGKQQYWFLSCPRGHIGKTTPGVYTGPQPTGLSSAR
jgi:hypothetical protein